MNRLYQKEFILDGEKIIITILRSDDDKTGICLIGFNGCVFSKEFTIKSLISPIECVKITLSEFKRVRDWYRLNPNLNNEILELKGIEMIL